MADLGVEFAGVVFKNPVLIASSSLTNNIRQLKRLEEAGAGGVVTKHTCTTPVLNPADFRAVVLDNGWCVQGDRRLSFEEGKELIRQAKSELSIPVIANFAGISADEDSWAENARALQEAGADMLEMDLANPVPEMASPAPGYGAFFVAQDASLTGKVTKAVKQAVDIPVIGKLLIKGVNPVPIAKACQENGADAIAAINAVYGLPGVDIRQGGKPLYLGFDKQPVSNYMGPPINPMAMWYTALLAETVDIPLSSSGGISTWENVVERLMLGATTVQLCSAAYLDGLEAITQCVAGLEKYLDEYGYGTPSEIIGQALEYIVPREQLVIYPLEARIVDQEKCLDCEGPCIERTNATCLAISREERVPSVDSDLCTGCCLCYYFCPEGAIEMRRK
jgi:dihydropyrimidine dehydrogenase (NAD+) subunit PreA